MITRPRYAAAMSLALIALGIVGCEDGRVRPQSTQVRVVHAAPTTGAIDFRREQASAASLQYRATSQTLTFDADQYDFNIDVAVPGQSQQDRVGTFSHEVLAGSQYLFVLTEDAGSVVPLIVENLPFESTTQTEVSAVHAAPSLGAMDVYFEPPGSDLATATPLGNVAFKGDLDPAALDAGEYRLTLTAPGDPANVLFSSPTMDLIEGVSNAFVIVDSAGDVAPLSVVVSGPAPGLLIDRTTSAGIEVINAAADAGARDIFLDGDYTAPLIPALAHSTVSAVMQVEPGKRKLNVTPEGNPGVVEDEQEVTTVRGRHHTQLIAGEPGSLSMATVQDDPRRIAKEARIRFMNGASQYSPMEFFLVPPGTDVTQLASTISLDAPEISERAGVLPGTYELILRDDDTNAILAGPQSVTLTNGLFTVLAINGATSGTADIVLLEDFN